MTKTPYTTIAKVQDYLLEDIAEGFQPNVERWILGISRAMDEMANRKLVADEYDSGESLELRYFDVDQYGFVSIDDCVEIESVEYKNGDSWAVLDDTAFQTYPALPPYRKLVYSFPPGLQTVRIRANWGYMETITEDLEWAATVLAAGVCIANQAVAGRNPGPVSSEKIGNYSVSYASGNDNAGKSAGFRDLDEAKQIVANYRKILI